MINRHNMFPLILILFFILMGCSETIPIKYSPLKNYYQQSSTTRGSNMENNPDEYMEEKEKLYDKLTKNMTVIGNTEDEDEEYEKNNEKDDLGQSYQQIISNQNDVEWFEKGCQAMIAKNWDEALTAFDHVIKLNPQNMEAHFFRGNIYDELGNYEKAIADYNKVIKLNPVHIDAYLRRGFAYNNLGKSKKALDNIKMAAKLGDNTAQKFLRERGMTW